MRLFTPIVSLLPICVVAATEPQVVPLRFEQRAVRQHGINTLSKRQYFPMILNNYMPLVAYYATIGVGTPPQTVEVEIATGFSDTWIFSPEGCSNTSCFGGSFNSTQSSTYDDLSTLGNFTRYYGTSYITGNYFGDNVVLGGLQLDNVTMALGNSGNDENVGILGLGPISGETYDKGYINIPALLYEQGQSGSCSYSLYLDALDIPYGTVLFGGYDSQKFIGDIVMLPIQPDPFSEVVDAFYLAWTSLSVSFDNSTTVFFNSTDFPMSVWIDTSTTLTFIPQDLFTAIADVYNATYNSDFGAYMVDCSKGYSTSTVNFGFSDNAQVISVPDIELAYPCYYYDGAACTYTNTTEMVCYFGVQPSAPGYVLTLGQTFLRSAYVLFDLDTQQVGLAQATINSTESEMLQYNPGAQNPRISTLSNALTITDYTSTANATTVAVATSSGWPVENPTWWGYEAAPTSEFSSLLPLTATPTGTPGLNAGASSTLTSSSSGTSNLAPSTQTPLTSFTATSSPASSTQGWQNVGSVQGLSSSASFPIVSFSSSTAAPNPTASSSAAVGLHLQPGTGWTVFTALVLTLVSLDFMR